MQKIKSFLYLFLFVMPLSICSMDQSNQQTPLGIRVRQAIDAKIARDYSGRYRIGNYQESDDCAKDNRTLMVIEQAESYVANANILFDYKNLPHALEYIIAGKSKNINYIGSKLYKFDHKLQRDVLRAEKHATKMIKENDESSRRAPSKVECPVS